MTRRAVAPRPGATPRALLATVLWAAACSAPPSSTTPPGQVHDGPPAAAQVRDGLGADLDTQEMRSSLFANWDPFVDPEGLPVLYEWAIGTTPGGAELQPWTSIGGATSAATQGLQLPEQATLFVSVRAKDLAGNLSPIATSDGVRIGSGSVGTAPSTGGAAAAPTPPDLVPAGGPAPGQLTAVERHGITWAFAQPAQCGRFANGDWWVLGPVELVEIRPRQDAADGRHRNGSMQNPDPKVARQGYDSAIFAADPGTGFDPALDVARGISAQQPLRLLPGTSLVSAVSNPLAGQLPQLDTCAVLTCLAEPPAPDAFRPPYCGTDKTCRWRAGALDLTRLASLAPVEGTPDAVELTRLLERTWLDHAPGWTGRFLHPRDNMPDAGRDLADLVGQCALVLQLDLPEPRKRQLALHLVQIGIDLYGIVANGGRFVAEGGSGAGRKFPVLLAGALLQDEALLRCAREQSLAFAEDAQTFYVAATGAGRWNHGHGGYGIDDEGLAEWGNRHADDPSLDQKPWTADPFRRCCTANAWLGFVLATRIMGLREAWGHPALFDYVDRYLQIETPRTWTRAWNPFAERMWDRYRADY